MTPSQYLSSLKPAERRELAKRMNTSFAFLRNVQYGTKKLNPVYARRLELHSGGVVPRQLTLPPEVWRELWPELPEVAPPDASPS